MKVIAKSILGQEYLYNARSARRISERNAEKILKVLNDVRWDLEDNEIWYIHEVDQYDIAFAYAQRQSFKIRKGVVSACMN